ncbi:unnamed protein product [Fraxinus pennsylvanica]|uniref:Uncharacterized protein n=1 Tax=Fraxinus pennsylvanica TaxID=56036 RepID=A0AAD1ZI98_9LAMI|nr:unnamed protein product [Fraxinus pennsylvanica]
MFRRFYRFDPPKSDHTSKGAETRALRATDFDPDLDVNLLPKLFGNSTMPAESIPIAEFQGRPVADHPAVKYGRPPGILRVPREPLDATTVAEAVSVISCWLVYLCQTLTTQLCKFRSTSVKQGSIGLDFDIFNLNVRTLFHRYEDKTEWGDRVGWIYDSVTEDVVTGYRMHNRGWRSVFCITKHHAFRGSAPINLTDRLHQVLRWATGSVEIFFSRNNALLGTKKLKFIQHLAYLNVGVYPITSLFLIVYCFLPALSLLSGHSIVKNLNIVFLIYILTISICLIALAILEVKWSSVGLEEWWRNEQFWLISGTRDDNDDIYADLYLVKWTSLMIPPIVIGMINIIAMVVAFSRTIYSSVPQWSKFIGGAFFSFWVLAHLYPFAKGLMGRRGKTPTIVFVWSGPVYVGTGCMFRRFALYGFDPPKSDHTSKGAETRALRATDFDPDLDVNLLPNLFGNSTMLAESIPIAEFQGRPVADHPAVKYGRPPGILRVPREPLDATTVAEAVSVISCWYEDKTEWGDRVGWIYGSVTEDVVTGYRMHNRGWRSVFCITKHHAFRGSAPINLTDRLHQVLRWATGSVEIFFSRNNALLGTKKLKFIQRLAYLNVGIQISFTLASKSEGDDNDDIYADLYLVKWTSLMIPPIVIGMINIIAMVVAFSRTIYSSVPQWSKFIGGAFFSFWVLAHLYPFAKGLMGSRGKTPTIVFVWFGLTAITLSLLWVAISPPRGTRASDVTGGGGFQFP